jgi:ribonuclease J
VVHTGDFKMSQTVVEGMLTDVNRFAQCGEEGVLALLSDSTNVEKDGHTISAQEIGAELARITEAATGRIIVALFASNIARIQQIVNIAETRGRKIVFNGRSIEVSVAIARKLGYLEYPEGMEIDIDELNTYPDDEIIMVTTGSQGEPMSALARMAAGTHKQIKIHAGGHGHSLLQVHPGQRKGHRQHHQQSLPAGRRRGLRKDFRHPRVRARLSGRAEDDDQPDQAQIFMPIHGEYRHLVLHTRLARQVGIPDENLILAQNGQIIELDKKGFRIRDGICAGACSSTARASAMWGAVCSRSGGCSPRRAWWWSTWPLTRRPASWFTGPISSPGGSFLKRRRGICSRMPSA